MGTGHADEYEEEIALLYVNAESDAEPVGGRMMSGRQYVDRKRRALLTLT